MMVSDRDRVIDKLIVYIIRTINVLTIILMGVLCFNSSIWKDETWDLEVITHPYSYFLLHSRDASPPFHFAILKMCVEGARFCFPSINYIYVAKLCSLIPFVIIVIISNTYVKKKCGDFTGALCGLLCITMPQLFPFGIEIRQYSWAVCLAFVWFCAFISYYENSSYKNVLLITIFGPLAVFSHYYIFFGIVYAYSYYLIDNIVHKKWVGIKRLVVFSLGACVCFSPWIFVAGNEVYGMAKSFWIPPITGKTALYTLVYPFIADTNKYGIGNICGALLIIIIASLFVNMLFESYSASKSLVIIGVTMPFVVGACGLLVGILVAPVFQPRYVMPIMGCFWLCFSYLLCKLIKRNAVRYCLLCFIGIISFLNIYKHTKDEIEYKKNIVIFESYINENKDLIILDDVRMDSCVPYYTDTQYYVVDQNNVRDDRAQIYQAISSGKTLTLLHSTMNDVGDFLLKELADSNVEMAKILDCGVEYVGLEVYRVNKR